MNLLSPATPVLSYGRLVNQASPLNRGPVAWWLNLPQGGKGNTFFDVCGKNHGTLTNGPTWTGAQGRPGGFGALDFDGTDDQVAITPFVSGTNAVSVSGWVLTRSTAAGEAMACANQGGNGTRFYCPYRNGSELGMRIGNVTLNTTGISTDVWYHVAGTWDGTTGIAYVNGLSVESSAATGVTSFNSTAMKIGSYGAGSSGFWSGLIDSLRAWNRALSAAEVWADFQDSRQGYPTTLNRIRLPVLGEAGGGGGGANRRRRVIICGAAA